MKIILAQGNIGAEYVNTRHNIGFMIAENFAENHSAKFKDKPKFKAFIAEFSHNGEKVLIVKPKTFYNETGFTAQTICNFYKVNPAEDLLVICDDLALDFGTIRVREKGSSAGNNGLKSIISVFGSIFPRVRIGISNEKLNLIGSTNFVLGEFTEFENKNIHEITRVTTNYIDRFLNCELENHRTTILFEK